MPSADLHPQSTNIPLSAMPLVSPNALLYAHLNQIPPTRPSNRTPSQSRSISLNIGSLTHTNGSALIKLGTTTIVAGVRAELLPVSSIPQYRVTKTDSSYTAADPVNRDTRNAAAPNASEKQTGNDAIRLYNLLVPNLELATGCSPSHPANTAPSVEAQSLSQRLLSLLHTSNLLSDSDLEVTYTPPPNPSESEIDNDQPQLKAYWVLYIDMICISYGGSIFDAAWLAMYAALRDTLLPKAWWDPDAQTVLCSPEISDARKLNISGMPVPLSFGGFEPEKRIRTQQEQQRRQGGGASDGKKASWVLIDTDEFEEGVCEELGCVTVDMDQSAGDIDVLRIEKSGGGGIIGVEEVKQLISSAQERWMEWKGVLDVALKAAAAAAS